MTVFAAVVTLLLAAVAGETPAVVVEAADSPVRLDRATILTSASGPPVVLYAATNKTDEPLDQFTVVAFVFNAQGMLKATQVAPGRHILDPHETKFSTMVLDGFPIDSTAVIVVGVNQAQRVGSDDWWRAELQAAAETTQRKRP